MSAISTAGARLCRNATQGPGGKIPSRQDLQKESQEAECQHSLPPALGSKHSGAADIECCREQDHKDFHGCHLHVLLTCSSLPLVWACKLKQKEKTRGVSHREKQEGMMAVGGASLTTGVFRLSISVLRDGDHAA